MPRLVLLAKSTYVWLDQLSRRYGREIRTLDAIPDEELASIAGHGITGLWLIGLWQRSRASERIKRWRGNSDAVASAYSLDDYRIADDLGGEDALGRLRDQAWRHGIRLASDMVPNHMGIDSEWVIEHPERFIQLAEPPYPAYRFEGANVADDPRVEIRIEDHYWDDSDAAVVFERRDTATGERRYIYHGNDGTSFPWNDTAQLDFLQADVREVVIRTILDVARRFPVIRFDAAMVLAKKHVERLWYPEPGHAGGIPSRAEHGAMTKAAFNRLMPKEFWREVVDRVAAEAPDTLLLAEAFWLLEGYFVRTLGMHRVYNSAFMHMVRDEDNAGYRKVIRETLEFDPAILGRYVNFLTNPDEETAIEQFGTGDKYFGAVTLLATLPGLPMIGHGQLEGFTEKYGMEFQRARLDERPDAALQAHFDGQIVPLLRDRRRYGGSADFRLYDVVGDGGLVEDVFAYSNGRGGDRSLIAYHNRFGSAGGWIRDSVPVRGEASGRIEDAAAGHAGERAGPGRARRRLAPDPRPADRDRGAPVPRRAPLARPLHPAGRVRLPRDRRAPRGALDRGRAVGGPRRRDRLGMGPIAGRRPGGPSPPAGPRARRGGHRRRRPGDRGAPDRSGARRHRPAGASTTSDSRPRSVGPASTRPRSAATRLAVGLPHPAVVRDAATLARRWLDDPDVRAFLEVHDWEGRTYLSRERWLDLVALAGALDRAAGARRASPALGRLRTAAERAGDDVDRLPEALAAAGGRGPAASLVEGRRPAAAAPACDPDHGRGVTPGAADATHGADDPGNRPDDRRSGCADGGRPRERPDGSRPSPDRDLGRWRERPARPRSRRATHCPRATPSASAHRSRCARGWRREALALPRTGRSGSCRRTSTSRRSGSGSTRS